ncbi:hypothetical protein [Sphingosinithalassobacter portus]|uniref:hypothetical protein n=1 Tax=Stakelama portus TaxID=2676234 RepID=UPI0011AB8245|nr:hypothetical protein [Sphingosinithalassobacter portus]
MQTIQEISKKSGVSAWTIRKLVKAGFVKASEENPLAEQMRRALARQNPLSVEQLLALIDDPTLEYDLGRYADIALSQVAALGDVETTKASAEVCANMDDAADGRPHAIAMLGEWLRDVIPSRAVPHAWIAVRLVWHYRSSLRKEDYARIPLALIAARKEIEGWYRVETVRGRKMTFYQRPAGHLDL